MSAPRLGDIELWSQLPSFNDDFLVTGVLSSSGVAQVIGTYHVHMDNITPVWYLLLSSSGLGYASSNLNFTRVSC